MLPQILLRMEQLAKNASAERAGSGYGKLDLDSPSWYWLNRGIHLCCFYRGWPRRHCLARHWETKKRRLEPMRGVGGINEVQYCCPFGWNRWTRGDPWVLPLDEGETRSIRGRDAFIPGSGDSTDRDADGHSPWGVERHREERLTGPSKWRWRDWRRTRAVFPSRVRWDEISSLLSLPFSGEVLQSLDCLTREQRAPMLVSLPWARSRG